MPEDFLSSLSQSSDDADFQIDEYGDPIQSTEPETPISEPAPEPEVNEPEPTVEPEPTPEPEPAPVAPSEPQKPVQTPEDNARFAEQRRQQQLEERARQLAEERLKQSPEYQLAELVKQQTGLPLDQALKQIQQAALQRQAEAQGVPVEVLQRIQEAENRAQTVEQQLQQVQFNAWMQRIEAERSSLKAKYGFLEDADLDTAREHMLTVMRNPEIPLEQALMATHGQKIVDHYREQARQEALAEISGRKPSPLSPQGVRQDSPNAVELTDDEKYFARQFGLKESDYATNKTR